MATYQLNQVLEDTALSPITFTIPDEEGTYRLTFTTSDGRTFTGDVTKTVKSINETVTGQATSTTYTTTLDVGKGTMSNLTATPSGSNTISATATYNSNTGIITITMTCRLTGKVDAIVTGTLALAADYEISIGLSNGRVFIQTITV